MNRVHRDVNSLKLDSFEEALEISIPVGHRGGDMFLVPVGPWILTERQLVSQMVDWREVAKDRFFARFPPSAISFTKYLKSHSIQKRDTILFMLYSKSCGFLGHIGLTKVSKRGAEIDAVMIDPSLHGQGLAAKSISTLISWAEECVGIPMLTLEVMSSNESAIRLYSKFGFEISILTPLKEFSDGNIKTLVDCHAGEQGTGLNRVLMIRQSQSL